MLLKKKKKKQLMGLASEMDNNIVSFNGCDNGRFLVGGDWDVSQSFYISFT
jgi:hypothetical protein